MDRKQSEIRNEEGDEVIDEEVEEKTGQQFEGQENDEMQTEMEGEELEHECYSDMLLSRQTESFRCLQQTLLSSSSFMRNKNFRFPPPQDPGLKDAFYYVEPEPVYDDIGIEKYTRMCKDLEIVPVSRIIRSLPGDTLNLTYYGLTPKQMKALTDTLKVNTHVQKLLLRDNWMDPEVTEMLNDMLEENTSIAVLNLRECRIGEEGAEKLNGTLTTSHFLTELDLSFNSLGDAGLLQLQTGLSEAPTLRVLNLSHNNLTEECVPAFEKILLENNRLEELDISWNSFFTGPGNKKIFNAIRLNDNLHSLNIAWNGISQKTAATPISKYLKASKNLEYLDISHNRLEGPSLRAIKNGILKNHSLKCVKIGSNCYPPDEALTLAAILPRKDKDPLELLDMEDMVFEKDILKVLERIKRAKKEIKYGYILGNYVIQGPDRNKLLFERCKYILQKPKSKKKKKDFGHFILILPDQPMTRVDFDALLKKKKIKKLDKDLVDELCSRFLLKKNINCEEMKNSYMEYYPDTVLPPPPPKKKGKKGKKGKGKKGAEEVKADAAQATTPGAPLESQPAERMPSERQPVGQSVGRLATEGGVPEGELTEEEVTEGEDTEEEATEGEETERDATEGDATEGETTEGETTEEEDAGEEGIETEVAIVENTEDSTPQGPEHVEEM